MNAKVYLVGAGPGDPELLTLKALRVLECADLVLHDDLVSEEILALAPPRAVIESVGKRCGQKKILQGEINTRMIAAARQGKTVVRLKGGDPLLFARGGEEMEALEAAGVEFEVVPGVTAALAAAAAAKVPLTRRGVASCVVFLTGHRCAPEADTDGDFSIPRDSTVAFYMPGDDSSRIARQLERAGIPLETPCITVSAVSTRKEEVQRMTLKELILGKQAPAPSVVLVGEAVGNSLSDRAAQRSLRETATNAAAEPQTSDADEHEHSWAEAWYG